MKMIFGSSIFVLLTAIVQLFSAAEIDCAGNTYKNNPLLVTKLEGYLYTVYTSVSYSNNEIFKFDPIVKKNIHVRTTNDAKCCKTMELSTVLRGIDLKGKLPDVSKSHFEYVISNDKDCSTRLTETAHLKLLAANTDVDDSCCVILWTCRKSREGVHAFCTNRKVSKQQAKWISKQYKQLELNEVKVVQNVDYKNGKCFNKQKT